MAISQKLQQVGNSLIGGNVVTILLRQLILNQKIRKGTQPTKGEFAENPMPYIAGVPVTTRLQEAYTYQAEVTHHSVESGAILSDHVIIQPLRLDMAFEISNWNQSRAKYSFDLLLSLFYARQPVELITEHKILQNMIISNLQLDNSAPVWGKLSCRASFTQLKFITLETIKFPAAKVDHTDKTSGPATPKAASTAVDAGRQKPRMSVLKGLFSGGE